MSAALPLAKTGVTEEQRQETAANVAQSFAEAQAAWDAYRGHLIQHGLTPDE